MPTTRRTVDALGRRAGRRPISRGAQADLADALAEAEGVLSSHPAPHVEDLHAAATALDHPLFADLRAELAEAVQVEKELLDALRPAAPVINLRTRPPSDPPLTAPSRNGRTSRLRP